MFLHYLIFFSFVWNAVNVETKATFKICGTGIDCVTDSHLIENKTCVMADIDGESKWSIDVNFKDGVVIDTLYCTLSWNYRTANDMKFRPFLGLSNVSMDLCSYLTNGNSMLVQMFLEDFKRHSNLIHSCPFQGHCYIKDLSPNIKRFPAIIPSGAYVMWMVFTTKLNNTNHQLMDIKMYADVKSIR